MAIASFPKALPSQAPPESAEILLITERFCRGWMPALTISATRRTCASHKLCCD